MPILRRDKGLIFQSRRFRAACQDSRVPQEFITPYTPEQNGVIERFFRSLKEECVWQHQFHNFADARQRLRAWLTWYNTGRPHQALGYRSPTQFRATQLRSGGLMIRFLQKSTHTLSSGTTIGVRSDQERSGRDGVK